MSDTAIEILKEAVDWLKNTPEGRSIPQVNGQPGVWLQKALTLIEVNPQEVSITRSNLDWLTDQVKQYKQFKVDAEVDIGYLAETVYNLQNLGDPMKLVMKLVSGKLDMSSLGLDMDRLTAIAKKYAPQKFAELEQRAKSKTQK